MHDQGYLTCFFQYLQSVCFHDQNETFCNLQTFSEDVQTGGWLTDNTPVQKLPIFLNWVSKKNLNSPPGYYGTKYQITVLKVHNSIFEPVTFDDTEIFHTVMTWSTF